MDTGSDAKHARALSRHVLEQVVATVSEGVVLLDACDDSLPIVYVNPAYERLSGYAADELVGLPWRTVQRDEDSGLTELREAIGRSEPCQLTVLDVHKDGSTWFSFVEVSPLLDANGDLRFFLCRQRPVDDRPARKSDIEVNLLQRELGHARKRIASLSRTDAVTGLLAYGHFIALVGRDLAVARREGRDIAVIVFEVVEIDIYRSTFGSNAADSALRMIAAQVAGAFRRASDLCARRGDATIVVATRGQEDVQLEALTARVADKVRRLSLHNPRGRANRYLTVQSSIVAADRGAEDADALIRRCCALLAGGAPEEAPTTQQTAAS